MKFFLAFVALIGVASANPLNTWSLEDLQEAVSNPLTNPVYRPLLEFALKELLSAMQNGQSVNAIVVPAPVVHEGESAPTSWNLQELSAALQNPETDHALVPYLEDALNDLMSALISGQNVNSIVVNLPVQTVIVPGPVIVNPETPAPEIPEPEIPTPEIPEPETPSPVSSPLVQIIINVNGQQQVTHVVNPAEIVPTPVQVVDLPEDIQGMLRN